MTATQRFLTTLFSSRAGGQNKTSKIFTVANVNLLFRHISVFIAAHKVGIKEIFSGSCKTIGPCDDIFSLTGDESVFRTLLSAWLKVMTDAYQQE